MASTTLPPFYQMPCTEKADNFSSDFQLYLDQQYQSLSESAFATNGVIISIFKNEDSLIPPALTPGIFAPAILGLAPPSYTSAEINALATALDSEGNFLVPLGTIWYDTTNDKLKVLVLVAAVRTVQTITSA